MRRRYARPSYMPQYVPDADCELWFPGQDDPQSSTIRDKSGSGNDGTIVNSAWARTPSGLWYVIFDGTTDRIETPAMSMNGDRSIELWVRNTAGNDGNARRVFAWRYDADNLFYVRRNTTNDQWMWYVKSGGTIAEDGALAITDDALWHHVVLIIDKTHDKIYFYYDTVDKTSGGTAQAGTMVSDAGVLHFGCDYYDGNVWIGGVALMREHKRVLPSTVITGHYNQERHLFGV